MKKDLRFLTNLFYLINGGICVLSGLVSIIVGIVYYIGDDLLWSTILIPSGSIIAVVGFVHIIFFLALMTTKTKTFAIASTIISYLTGNIFIFVLSIATLIAKDTE
ncbi:MAG: hypothetical protein FWD89_00035 [Firmicutes bacterium]|nr:hypothetical protein [Bacillota bacterium]MCL2770691.1 hypothetical protein [Bacillota bacterium]